jgi:hypothetical protein
MFAKRFFYVCAGLLCLALAYHLGARGASAQGQGVLAVAEIMPTTSRVSAVVGRDILALETNGERFDSGTVPGSATIVAVDYSSGRFNAVLSNGDFYYRDSSGPWILSGKIFGPTGAGQNTWGQVKARYRQGAPAAPTPEGR